MFVDLASEYWLRFIAAYLNDQQDDEERSILNALRESIDHLRKRRPR